MEATNNGISNARTIFGIKDIPSDNHIRDFLDTIQPQLLYPMFDSILYGLQSEKLLDNFRSMQDKLLIGIDGIWYYDSKNIHCDNCSEKHHRDGTITYYHSMVSPAIIKPKSNKVISLPVTVHSPLFMNK